VINYFIVNLFVFQIYFDNIYKTVNGGRRVRELSRPEENFRWFRDPVRAFGLYDLLQTGYSSVTHAMVRALCERWHPETSSFHLPVGEMTITLHDVANLLHIPIEGHMLTFDIKMDREHAIRMMTTLLGMKGVAAAKACSDEYGGHITYTSLKRFYEEHLTEARWLEEPQSGRVGG